MISYNFHLVVWNRRVINLDHEVCHLITCIFKFARSGDGKGGSLNWTLVRLKFQDTRLWRGKRMEFYKTNVRLQRMHLKTFVFSYVAREVNLLWRNNFKLWPFWSFDTLRTNDISTKGTGLQKSRPWLLCFWWRACADVLNLCSWRVTLTDRQ